MDLPDTRGTLMERLGIAVSEATPDQVVASMPVEGNIQPFGLLHGGATAALCETVASLGALLSAGEGRTAVGVEINVNHLRSVREGSVTATAVPLRSGSSVAVWDVKVHDDDGRLTAVSRVTLRIIQRR